MAEDDHHPVARKKDKKSKHKKKRHRDDDEDRKKAKKHKKEKKKLKKESIDVGEDDDGSVDTKKAKKTAKKAKKEKIKELDEKIVSSSAIEFYPDELKSKQLAKNQEDEKQKAAAAAAAAAEEKEQSAATKVNNITLLLFYQYVEPVWDDDQLQVALKFVTDQGNKYGLTGRMRVAKEGLNCTLTGSHDGIRNWCAALRTFDKVRFAKTEFKITDDLPPKQRFPKLHPFEVVEIVNYGLAGSRAPEIAKYGGKFKMKWFVCVCYMRDNDSHTPNVSFIRHSFGAGRLQQQNVRERWR